MFSYRLFFHRLREALQVGTCNAGASLCKPRLVATLLALLGLIVACATVYLAVPGPALKDASSVRVGTVYMVSTAGKVRISDFRGTPKFEAGLFMWRDRRGMEYRTISPVLFESR